MFGFFGFTRSAAGLVCLASMALMGSTVRPAHAEILDQLTQLIYGQPLELDPSFESALSDVLQAPESGLSFKAGNKDHELRAKKKVRGRHVGTVKFKHYYKGKEVLGSEAFLHYSRGKKGRKTVRTQLAHFDLDMNPSVSEREAVALARSYALGQSVSEKPLLKILPDKKQNSARLIYSVQVEGVAQGLEDGRVEILLDAHTGAHLATLPKQMNFAEVPVSVLSARDQGVQVSPTYDEQHVLQGCGVLHFQDGQKSSVDALSCRALVKSSCQAMSEKGRPLSINPGACQTSTLVSTDPSGLRAISNAHAMLDYFSKVHQRSSYDEQGSPIVSIVHAGGAFSNAYWSLGGHFMAYGDGDGTTTGDFTLALDVAAHEFTHAITEYEIHMISIGETGALNEAYSDFFGKRVENLGSWIMGEKIAIGSGQRGTRDLAAPEKLMGDYFDSGGELRHHPYPSRMADMAPIIGPCTERNDYCAIHYNTTVPGHAAQQIFQAIGAAKAEQLYYLTLTQFLTATSDFQGSSGATLQACAQILDAADCARVRTVFSDAGML